MLPYARAGEVFISYASHDRNRVFRIVDRLESVGVSIWIDQKRIDGATRWAEEIVYGIENCRLVILMCSDASMRSWAVKQETQLAWECQKALLPLLLNKTSFPAQMRFFLAGVQWIEILSRSSKAWLPPVLRALKYAGVQFKETGSNVDDTVSVVKPIELEWSLEGLRSVARFTDQIWAFPADRSLRNANRSLVRGLGAAQEGVEHAFRLGSRIRIAIESEQEGHLLLLDEAPEGKLYCLCPSRFARDTGLPIGINTLPQQHSPYDAFVVTGKCGREQLLAIITDEPIRINWMPSDPQAPARVLNHHDINELLRKVRGLESGSWTALSTFFDVTPKRETV